MSIHKDNATGKWRVVYRYTDWTGETHQSFKIGFPTKREAQMWERELLLKKEAKLDMTFESFYEIYVEDMQNRIRDNTWGTKTNIARTRILPYFGKRKIWHWKMIMQGCRSDYHRCLEWKAVRIFILLQNPNRSMTDWENSL